MKNPEDQSTPSSSTNAAPLARGLGNAQKTPRDNKPTRPPTNPQRPSPTSTTRITTQGNRTNTAENDNSRTRTGPRR